MKSISYISGFLVGIITVIIASLIIRRFIKRRVGANAMEYDERQKLIQGQGFKLAYFVLLITIVIGGIADMLAGSFYTTVFVFVMLALWISICVYVTYCTIKDAYLTPATKLRILCMIFIIASIMNFIIFLTEGSPLLVDGKLDTPFVNLMTAVCTLYLAVLLIVKSIRDRRDEVSE